jgi:hypothetical protein
MKRLARLAALLIVLPAAGARADALEPAKTHVVIAGVLEWQNKGLRGFPTKHRKDKELRDVLVARGVPAGQTTLLLDEQATAAAVKDALKSACRKAGPGSTLVFYYCGHGSRCGADDTVLMNYDVVPGRPQATGLLVSDLRKLLREHFLRERRRGGQPDLGGRGRHFDLQLDLHPDRDRRPDRRPAH